MSDYSRYKVLRVPTEKYGIENLEEFENQHSSVFKRDVGFFMVAPTNKTFIDFVIEKGFNDEYGEYGKVRNLTPAERIKYYDIFRMIIPNIHMEDVQLIDYCWYDCSEAPDYYGFEDNPFYKELPHPSELKQS